MGSGSGNSNKGGKKPNWGEISTSPCTFYSPAPNSRDPFLKSEQE